MNPKEAACHSQRFIERYYRKGNLLHPFDYLRRHTGLVVINRWLSKFFHSIIIWRSYFGKVIFALEHSKPLLMVYAFKKKKNAFFLEEKPIALLYAVDFKIFFLIIFWTEWGIRVTCLYTKLSIYLESYYSGLFSTLWLGLREQFLKHTTSFGLLALSLRDYRHILCLNLSYRVVKEILWKHKRY